MQIWYSHSGEEQALTPLGNGALLVWEEGVSIFSLRMGYSAPHLLSLLPEFGGRYHEIAREYLSGEVGAYYRLYYTDQTLEAPSRTLCDLQITDRLCEGMPLFSRRMDGIAALSWKLSLPGYVRKAFLPNYRFGKRRADTLFLTIPAGTPMESELATLREQTVAIILCGSLRYDPQDSTLYYGGDLAQMYILSADDPAKLVQDGDRLIAAFSSFGEEIGWESIDEKSTLSTDALLLRTIRATYALDGVQIASHREPFAQAADLPALTAVYLANKDFARVNEMLLRFANEAKEGEGIPARLITGNLAVWENGLPQYTAAAAYLLAATAYLRQCSPDEKESASIFRAMRRSFAFLMQGMHEGMLPLGSYDRAFEAGIFGRELLFQGSAETTALAIAAGEGYLQYCKESGRRAAREEQGYRDALAKAKALYEANFTREGIFYRNAPRLEGLVRRPRFVRGICVLCQQEGAYPFEEALELDKYGRYLCRRCLASRRNAPEVIDPWYRYVSARATALAALLGLSHTAVIKLPEIALDYLAQINRHKHPLPIREGDTDPLILLALCERRQEILRYWTDVPDAFLTAANAAQAFGFDAEKSAEALWDFLVHGMKEHLLALAKQGSLPTLLCDCEPLGSRCATGATALCYLALKAAEKWSSGFDRCGNFYHCERGLDKPIFL